MHIKNQKQRTFKATTCFEKNSQLTQDAQKTGHIFDFENISILNICPQWSQKKKERIRIDVLQCNAIIWDHILRLGRALQEGQTRYKLAAQI